MRRGPCFGSAYGRCCYLRLGSEPARRGAGRPRGKGAGRPARGQAALEALQKEVSDLKARVDDLNSQLTAARESKADAVKAAHA